MQCILCATINTVVAFDIRTTAVAGWVRAAKRLKRVLINNIMRYCGRRRISAVVPGHREKREIMIILRTTINIERLL